MSGAVRKPTARKSAPVSDTDESDEDDNNHKVHSKRFSNGNDKYSVLRDFFMDDTVVTPEPWKKQKTMILGIL